MKGRLLATLLVILPFAGLAVDKATIRGDRMILTQSNQNMILEGHVKALKHRTQSRLRAERLELKRDENSEELSWGRAEGEVLLIESNRLLLTEYATFDDEVKIAQLQGKVFITTGELFMKGHKLDYNYEEERGRLVGKNIPVELILHKKDPDEQGRRLPIQGWADEILIDRGGLKITLQGQVRLEDLGDNSEMLANRVEIFFNEAEELQELIAVGNFSLKQPKRNSKAGRAHLDYNTKIITLTEDAYVRQAQEAAIKGDRIQMHMDSKKGILKAGRHRPVRIELDR